MEIFVLTTTVPPPPRAMIGMPLVVVADSKLLLQKSSTRTKLNTRSFSLKLALKNPRRSRPCCSSFDDDDDDDSKPTPNNTVVNLDVSGLRQETKRQETKALKKVANATTKLRLSKEKMNELLENPNATTEMLEECPDVDFLESDVEEKKKRLEEVRTLLAMVENFTGGKKNKEDDSKWQECAEFAMKLGISDAPPPKPPRGPKKVKNVSKTGPRRPYFAYASGNDVNDDEDIPTTEIRVGRTSEDNDIVSLDPTNDPNEWWMHAAGCPGSHVVIKSTAPSDAAFFDAALLAAKFSKASRVGRVKVSVVRCRQVSKPKGAKPGLVRLSGDVRTMEVRVDENLDRLEMLERTKT
jgi:hypothetical protein